MNNSVLIYDVSASRAIEFKYELVNDGLVPDVDFVWEFTPSKYSNWPNNDQETSLAKYTFDNDSLASFYRLKWTK